MSRAVLPGHAPLRGVAVQGRPPLLTQHLGLLECSPVGQGGSDDGQACQHISHLICPTCELGATSCLLTSGGTVCVDARHLDPPAHVAVDVAVEGLHGEQGHALQRGGGQLLS